MNNVAMFKLGNTNGVATMSSLEMVDYVNSSRANGSATLQHKDFLEKVVKVLGKAAAEFSATAYYEVNNATRTRTIYNFPKREAMLMAMSYSYELQANIFDAWQDAEEALKKPTFVVPTTLAGALRLAADESEKKEEALLQLSYAQPKIEFHDAVVADDTVYKLAEAAKVLDIAPRKFNTWLRDNKFVMQTLVPYERWKVQGILVSRFSGFIKPDGSTAPATTYVTSKGITYFQKHLKLA